MDGTLGLQSPSGWPDLEGVDMPCVSGRVSRGWEALYGDARITALGLGMMKGVGAHVRGHSSQC